MDWSQLTDRILIVTISALSMMTSSPLCSHQVDRKPLLENPLQGVLPVNHRHTALTIKSIPSLVLDSSWVLEILNIVLSMPTSSAQRPTQFELSKHQCTSFALHQGFKNPAKYIRSTLAVTPKKGVYGEGRFKPRRDSFGPWNFSPNLQPSFQVDALFCFPDR